MRDRRLVVCHQCSLGGYWFRGVIYVVRSSSSWFRHIHRNCLAKAIKTATQHNPRISESAFGGARHESASHYSTEHGCVGFVVSSDGPIFIFKGGHYGNDCSRSSNHKPRSPKENQFFRDSTTCNISKSPLSFDHAKQASPSRRLNLLGDVLPGNDGS